VVIADNYPEETSINVHNVTSDQELLDVSIGDIPQLVIGVPLSFSTCATVGDVVEVEISDSYGDGLGASQWGGQDGDLFVVACGDTLWELPQADFGYSTFSEFTTPTCIEVEDVVGCGDPDYLEYNPDATIQLDILCETLAAYGCIDTLYFNYDSLANAEDAIDSCFYTLTITDGIGDGWFGSWLGIYQNGWASPQYKMGPSDGTEEVFDVYLSAEEEIELFFFTTPQSQNQVNQCGFMLVGPTGDTLIDISQWSITPFPNTYSVTPYCGNTCVPFAYGCTDETAQNYDAYANTENGSCYYNAGCTQAGYVEYYNQGYEADYDDGSCETLALFGCMDSEALNYDSEANVDTGDCIEVVLDCMDPNAFNYNELANVSDEEACLYDAGCITGPGEPYWANDYCYSWVIEVDPYCCETAWDAVCEEMYDYCGEGVTSVEVVRSELHFFPNPTAGVVNIQAPVGTVITLFDARGRVIETTTGSTVELPSPGPYVIMANYKGRIKREKIVRQ